MNNLVLAYAIALKHFCRAEYGLYYEDLYPLVSLCVYCALTSSSLTKIQPTEALLHLKRHRKARVAPSMAERTVGNIFKYLFAILTSLLCTVHRAPSSSLHRTRNSTQQAFEATAPSARAITLVKAQL